MTNSSLRTNRTKAATVAVGWLAGIPLRASRRLGRVFAVGVLSLALALSISENADAVGTPRSARRDAEADSLALAFAQHRQLVAAFDGFGVAADRTGPVVAAVEREARRFGIDPLLVAAVIAMENPDLNPSSVSSAGAVGIMQVMPQWGRSFRERCGGGDLTDVGTNVCFGVNVLQSHIDDAQGSVPRGLLAYVGCVKDVACRRYPEAVIRRWRDASNIAD